MKYFSTYGIIVLSFCLLSFVSANDVISAIKNGSASQLSKHFDNTIQITLIDKSNTFSKSQGELVLKDFFNNNSVKGFDIVHKGSNLNAQFIIGILSANTGDFRTTIYLKKKAEKQLLKELRFEK